MRVQWASVQPDKGRSRGRGIGPFPSSGIKFTFIIRHFTLTLIRIFSLIRFSRRAAFIKLATLLVPSQALCNSLLFPDERRNIYAKYNRLSSLVTPPPF